MQKKLNHLKRFRFLQDEQHMRKDGFCWTFFFDQEMDPEIQQFVGQ